MSAGATRKPCAGCGRHILTWAEQRAQYGRMLKSGLTVDQAKAATPRCQKCTTAMLRGGRLEWSVQGE